MAIRMKLGASNKALRIDTIVEALIIATAIAEVAEALIETSATQRGESSMSVLGALGDDIDYRVDGICPPDGSARASDDFDAFNVFEQRVLDLPVNARNKGRINAAAVYQY